MGESIFRSRPYAALMFGSHTLGGVDYKLAAFSDHAQKVLHGPLY